MLSGFDLFQKIAEVDSYKTLEELDQVFKKEKYICPTWLLINKNQWFLVKWLSLIKISKY